MQTTLFGGMVHSRQVDMTSQWEIDGSGSKGKAIVVCNHPIDIQMLGGMVSTWCQEVHDRI